MQVKFQKERKRLTTSCFLAYPTLCVVGMRPQLYIESRLTRIYGYLYQRIEYQCIPIDMKYKSVNSNQTSKKYHANITPKNPWYFEEYFIPLHHI